MTRLLPHLGRATRHRPPLALAPLLAALLVAAPAAAAQEWVALDAQPEGTPAMVTLVASQSNEQTTVVDVTVHGFYREDVLGDDGKTYQRLTFPGLETLNQEGAPELPAAHFALSVSSDAATMRFDGMTVLKQAAIPNLLPYPTPIPGEDEEIDPTGDPGPGDTQGSEETFTIDTAIYGGSDAWPSKVSQDAPVEPMLGPVAGATLMASPALWDPTTETLTVFSQLELSYSAPGASLPQQVITKLADGVAAKAFLNWSLVKIVWPFDPVQYHSRYLIIATPLWWDTLEPFVQHKQSLGYEVTLDSALPDVASVRQAIADWYAAGDPGMDHYCLLVGDTSLIPLGTVLAAGVTVVQTDDVYGTVGAINTSKEVHVGRLSVDNEANLAQQLQKIMDYELSPVPGGDYQRALIVAHAQNAPFKYTLSMVKVLGGSYSHPPQFTALFGYQGATTAQVLANIDAGVGLVAYRGHGSTTTWSAWNTAAENLHKNDLASLANPVHPVVWSIACTNANLDYDGTSGQDSISEVWLEVDEGAVASYGATRTTSTTPNHFLNEILFDLVYDSGVTTHAQALELGELLTWIVWPNHKNPWAYLLLGDPSMTIRRDQAQDLLFNLPGTLSLDDPGVVLDLQVLDPSGGPAEQGLVSVYKESFLAGMPAEVTGAWWTDDTGFVSIDELPLLTPGTLLVTARDVNGNLTQQAVEVGMGAAWEDLGADLPAGPVGPALAGTGTLFGGTPWSLLLTGAPPAGTAFLCLGLGKLELPFKGGVLVPDITPPAGLILPLPVDGDGNLALSSTWPAGLPAGATFVFQYWMQDGAGPFGFSASNAVVGTTP